VEGHIVAGASWKKFFTTQWVFQGGGGERKTGKVNNMGGRTKKEFLYPIRLLSARSDTWYLTSEGTGGRRWGSLS